MKEFNANKEVEEMLREKIEDIKQRCDRNTVYISDAERHLTEFKKDLLEKLNIIQETLNPIAKTYGNIAFAGKLGGILLTIFVTISGLIWGWVEFGEKIIKYLKGQ